MADNQFINFNSQDVADMYRRNQYARMLQDQANAPIERASYKGIEAPLHPVQGVAKMAAALLAGYQQNQMDERYSNEKAAAEQKLVAERERSQNEFKEYGEQYNDKVSQGYSPDYVNSPSNYGTPQTVSTPLSPQQRLAVAMKNRMNPNERIASDARAEIEQGNTMAQNEARTAERLATEATRQRERKEDIKIRADEFKALRAEAAAKSNAPTRKEQVEKNLQETAKDNIEATLKRMDANYKTLRDIGGMRTQTGNPLSNLASAVGSSLPYVAQGKKESLLRESLDSDLQSLLMPAMKASGMTAQMMNTPAEVNRYMKTLGGTGISYEGNQPILERLHTELVGRPNNPFNKDSRIKSIMDMYAPPKVK